MAKKIAVFCSANSRLADGYFQAATEFAQGLVDRGWGLVYGGASRGLMGHFADEVLKAGGRVDGAITADLASGPEKAHENLTQLVIVKDLFERKSWMMKEADGFAIFPGGLGTLDEALEVLTWKALGSLDKPIVFVNLARFWQNQITVFQQFALDGMIRPQPGLSIFEVRDSAAETLAVFDAEFRKKSKSGP
jgi:uncharacterized protein (TIGR00730 family)